MAILIKSKPFEGTKIKSCASPAQVVPGSCNVPTIIQPTCGGGPSNTIPIGNCNPPCPPCPSPDSEISNLLRVIIEELRGISPLPDILTILQGISATLSASRDSLNLIAGLTAEGNAKLDEIKAKLDSEIAILSSIIAALNVLHSDNLVVISELGVLHSDNLVVEGKLDVLHSDNVVVEGKLDEIEQELDDANTNLGVLHSDNVVVEGKLDTINITLGGVGTSVTTFNTSFDAVKQPAHGTQYIRSQPEELGGIGRLFVVLNKIVEQLELITEEEMV